MSPIQSISQIKILCITDKNDMYIIEKVITKMKKKKTDYIIETVFVKSYHVHNFYKKKDRIMV